MTISGGLANGAITSVTMSIPPTVAANAPGTTLRGILVANYTVASEGTNYVTSVATLVATAQ